MPQSGNVLLGDSLDLLAVGLQSALYPSSRLHSPTAHVQHLHTREAVLLHRLGQDRNERLRVLRDRRVVYASPPTPTRTEQRQDRQRLGERRLHPRAHHLRAQLVVYASRAAAAPTVQVQLLQRGHRALAHVQLRQVVVYTSPPMPTPTAQLQRLQVRQAARVDHHALESVRYASAPRRTPTVQE